MDEIDNKIKDIWKKEKISTSDIKIEHCPGDEILSLYIDGALEETEKERIEQHLLECNYCLDAVLLHKEMSVDAANTRFPDAPVVWKDNVKKLFTDQAREGEAGLLDIVLRLTKETIEVISNPGNLAITSGAMPGPVRSAHKILSPNLIILSKTFSDMESEVEVERVDDLHVNMKIRTIDIHSRAPVTVLRISLFNPLRELASYITDNGEVYFGNLNYGEYEIKIIKDSEEVGKVSLNITLNIN
jgi:hypothetical protein